MPPTTQLSSLCATVSPLADTQPLRWPLDAETFVFWGGDVREVNQHAGVPPQRYALDLCMAAPDGRTHGGDGKRNEDYLVYGRPVLAAGAGTVRVVVGGVPDNEPGEMNEVMAAGNTVIVEQAPSEYAHYAHLKPGSLRVRVGQRVRAGEKLGLVGNSGNSSEPHLHFHVQDAARMGRGLGVAPVFGGVLVTRGGQSSSPERYRPIRGDRVRPHPVR